MAKVAKQKKIKQPRKTKAAVKSIDLRFNGTEPLDISNRGYTQALNWYNYEYDIDQARVWLLEYMKREDYSKKDITSVRRSNKYAVPTTIGWQARMMMNGNVLPDSSMDYFRNRLAQCINEVLDIEEATQSQKPVISIQDRMLAKHNAIHAQVEGEIIDERASMYDFLVREEMTAAAATFLKEKYEPIYDEVASDDDDVIEAYGKGLKAERAYWKTVIDDLDRFVNNKKVVKVRKPRSKKVKSAVDLTKGLKYQKEYGAFKIVSINPAEIIGASQLWTYNTKYRKLSHFIAHGPAGLQVKRTTLDGFDPDKSVTKRIGHKPEDVINGVLKAGKVALRSIMTNLKNQPETVKGRINNDVILLRVIK